MSERSVLVRLQANIADFRAQMAAAERSVKGVGDQSEKTSREATTSLGRLTQSAQRNRQEWETAGTALAGFGAVSVAALGATVKAAVDWESAWTGVTKTVDGSASEMSELEGELRGLARTLPATHGEIAAVAEAAGQLGVKREDVSKFTKTMVDLGETTNLSADEAATSLAQMMNVMQTAPEDVGRLGASLVALGNAGASTEADILSMASYLTGAGALIGASESDVLALANTMTSLGINAERGGGVMTRTMQDIYTAVQNGGDELQGFAEVAGMSADEFARAFEEDPIRAIGAFTDGLAAAKDRGENVVGILGDLGIKGTQDTAVLLQMAGAQGMVNENLDLGAEAWAQNSALTEEAGKRYDTTAAKLAMARNGIVDAAISIGDTFMPVLAEGAEVVADLAGWLADLPEPAQIAIGGLAGVAGVAALAGGAFLLLFPRVVETVSAFRKINAAHPGVTDGLGKVGRAAGIAGGAFVALQIITSAFRESTDELDRFASKAAALGGPDVQGQITGLTEEIANQQAIVDEAAISWEVFGVGIFSNDEAKTAADRIDYMNERLEALKHQKELDKIASEQAAAAAAGMAGATGAAGDAAAVMGPKIESVYDSLETYAAYLGLDEDATEELRAKTEELGQTLADFVNPLGVYTTLLDEKKAAEQAAAQKVADETADMTDSWEDYASDVGVTFDEYMARLEEQVSAQANWRTNMLILAGQVSEGTLAELSRMGPEGAPLVADLVNRSDAELDRFDEITAMRSKEATDAWGRQLTLAAPVLAEVGKQAGAGVVAELAAQLEAGTITVADIANRYGINIANGINPILTSLGKQAINGYRIRPQADGSVMDFYANGGMAENHVAQIAPAGAWRVWAEEETGGEAYIPLAASKRTRSVDIWRETGRRLGQDIDRIEAYANGGFSDESDVPKPYSTSPFGPPISSAAAAAMQAEYDAATEWLKANVGTLGTGSLTSGVAGMFAAVKRQFPEARLNSGFRPGDPGFHGLRRAIDLGQVGRAGGNGHPYLAAMNRWLHDSFGANLAELIYDGAGDDRPDLKNGRPLNYGAATEGQHRNHVHVAMDKGGIFNPHIRDAGGPLLPGFTFNGTGGPEETVLTRKFVDAASTAPAVQEFDYRRLAAALESARPVHFYTPDVPAAVRALDAHEQRRAALAPAW